MTKGGNLKKTLPLQCDNMGERGLGRHSCWNGEKKSFLKTGIANCMAGTKDDYLWQESGESSEEKDEQEPARWDTDAHLAQQEWEDMFGNSDGEDFEGFAWCVKWFCLQITSYDEHFIQLCWTFVVLDKSQSWSIISTQIFMIYYLYWWQIKFCRSIF